MQSPVTRTRTTFWSVRREKFDGSRYKYPVVGISSGIDDLSPEKVLTEGVSHRLTLPIYEVNFRDQRIW